MISKKEALFLAELRKNSRTSLKSISKKTGTPISTLHDKLKRYEKDIITKHTSLVDFKKIGYKAIAKVITKVETTDRDRLKEFLERHSHVNSLFKINNGYDFMFEIIFEDLDKAEEFIEKLTQNFEIRENQVHYILDQVKVENFLSNGNYINLTQ